MTLNTEYRLSPQDSGLTHVRWTAPNADDVSWCFVNGQYVFGPMTIGVASRIAAIPFTADEALTIEIHDIASSEPDGEAINSEPNVQPTIAWNRVDEAELYRIYYHAYGDDETVLTTIWATSEITLYEFRCPIELANGWHFFRVESVDSAGNESTQASFAFFVFELPAINSTLAVANGSSSGLFDFAVT